MRCLFTISMDVELVKVESSRARSTKMWLA